MIKRKKQFIFSLFMLLFNLYYTGVFAINDKDTITGENQLVDIFLDINAKGIDFTFIKMNMVGVNFLFEPSKADIHIIITGLKTAGGGIEYSIDFIGKNNFVDNNLLLRCSAYANDTEDKIRNTVLKTLQIGILPYLSQKKPTLEVKINEEKKDKDITDNYQYDKWNFWVFTLDLRGDIEKEQNQQELSSNLMFNANRVTELWKIKNKLKYKFNELIVDDDEELIINNEKQIFFKGEAIRSLTERFSVGAFANYESNTAINIKSSYSFSPAVEYNIFPWSESYKRVFTIGYYFGFKYFDYFTTTIYDKNSEFLPFQTLKTEFNIVSDWGNIESSLSWRNYMTDYKKYRLSLQVDLSIRLNRWMSFVFEMEANSIHDQIYLANEEVSLEDILLKRKELATNYEFNSSVGIRIYVGSIYNNIVNKRL